jgi:nucleoside-diphosphate-sugar epimerase
MKILITGASGYVGQRLALLLAESGFTIHALVRNLKSPQFLSHPNIKIFYGDILKPKQINDAIQGCETVFHLASLARIWTINPDDFYLVNVQGTVNVLEASLEAKVKRFVHTSSTGVIGPSLKFENNEETPRWSSFNNDYEISKYQAEQEVLKYYHKGLPAVIVSPSRIYGPGIDSLSSGVNNFINGFLKRRVAFVAKKTSTVGNYAYIEDVIRGHILAMEKGKAGEKYILGGENLTFEQLFHHITQHAQNKGFMVKLPKKILKNFAWIQVFMANSLKRYPKITPDLVTRLGQNSAFSSQKAIEELGYKITPFREGLEETVKFLKQKTNSI